MIPNVVRSITASTAAVIMVACAAGASGRPAPRGAADVVAPPRVDTAASPEEGKLRLQDEEASSAPVQAKTDTPNVSPGLPAGCGPEAAKFKCSPLTNLGCDAAAGEACDDDEHGGFKCYPSPNVVKEGGDCNIVEGPSCAAGLGCSGADESDPDGECAKYCCSDSECPSKKKCKVIDKHFGGLGFCE